MKLTKAEQQICRKYSRLDGNGKTHCLECPLVLDYFGLVCYANIDGRTSEAKALRRYKEDSHASL